MEFRKHAFILQVIKDLQSHESRTGKTHVQKTLFLINEATPIQVPFEFVLYKHGPYSFDIESELEQMKSYDAISIEPSGGYGVELKPSTNAGLPARRTPLSSKDKDAIASICAFVQQKGVVDLERMATAVWVRNREHITDAQKVAERIHALKPHISIPDAETADQSVTQGLTLQPK